MHRSLLEITFNGSPGAERWADVFCVDLEAPLGRKIPRPPHIGYGRFSRLPPGEPYTLTALVFSGGSFEHAWSASANRASLTMSEFRVAPDSGGKADIAALPICANSVLMHRSVQSLFDHLVGDGEDLLGAALGCRIRAAITSCADR